MKFLDVEFGGIFELNGETLLKVKNFLPMEGPYLTFGGPYNAVGKDGVFYSVCEDVEIIYVKKF